MLAGRPVQGNVIYTYLFRERRDPLDPTAVIEHPVNGDGGWTPLGESHTPQPNPHATFCAAGDYPAPEGPDSDTVDDVPVAECAVAHDGRFNEGSRAGYVRRIDYPARLAGRRCGRALDRRQMFRAGGRDRHPPNRYRDLPAGPDRPGHRGPRDQLV